MFCLHCNKPLSKRAAHYGQHLSCFEGVFGVIGRVEFESLARKSEHESLNETAMENSPHLSSYFAGNYKKYEGRLNGESYILKFPKAEYPELSAVEFISNLLARHCGIKIPLPFSLIALSEHEQAFVSKNFMHRQRVSATLTHIYHGMTKEDSYDVETISRVIGSHTRRLSDIEMFFKTLLFDALIGNHDRHGRNLAFIETAKGNQLAPIYDNPSALGLESGSILKAQFSPRGKIWTAASREPQMRDYLVEMKRLNVFPIALKFYARLNVQKMLAEIKRPHLLSQEMQSALSHLLKNRFEELKSYVTQNR